MKKILMMLAAITLILSSCTMQTSENNSTVKINQTWSENLNGVVEAYDGCPEGWETKTKARPFLPAKMYCNRPALPKDFGDIKILYETGRIQTLDKISPNYYDQPEFFPNFALQTIPALNNYNPNRFGVTIPEVYPSAKVFEGVPPGTVIEADTLVRSGPLGEKYIWLDTVMVYPNTFNWARNMNYKEETNPEDVENYFEVNISPDTILLEPSFPVWPANWTKKLRITVKVKENTPNGRYAIGLMFEHTANKTRVDDSWFKYGTKYADTMLIKPTTPWYILYIEVAS
jgi:hypothetical protein